MHIPHSSSVDVDVAELLGSLSLRERVDRGLRLCRAGRYEDGHTLLRTVTEEGSTAELPSIELPGVFFSYLGYCIAAFEARYNDGLALCERAIEMEFYNTENHFNLARTYMLLESRKKAIQAVRAGLRVDPQDGRLRALMRELGLRKRPPIPFLDRSHTINRWLGSLRHYLTAPPKKEDTE